MAKFRVVTQKPEGVTFDLAGGSYELEMEALGQIGAEIEEVPAKSEEEFRDAARGADAVIARGRPITANIIDGLENCKVISLGSVGADSVDVPAATRAGIPVTNVPDTFIEEVADHTLMMILGAFRRVRIMDAYVRDGPLVGGQATALELPQAHGTDARLRLLRARRQGDRGESEGVRSAHDRPRPLHRGAVDDRVRRGARRTQ